MRALKGPPLSLSAIIARMSGFLLARLAVPADEFGNLQPPSLRIGLLQRANLSHQRLESLVPGIELGL